MGSYFLKERLFMHNNITQDFTFYHLDEVYNSFFYKEDLIKTDPLPEAPSDETGPEHAQPTYLQDQPPIDIIDAIEGVIEGIMGKPCTDLTRRENDASNIPSTGVFGKNSRGGPWQSTGSFPGQVNPSYASQSSTFNVSRLIESEIQPETPAAEDMSIEEAEEGGATQKNRWTNIITKPSTRQRWTDEQDLKLREILEEIIEAEGTPFTSTKTMDWTWAPWKKIAVLFNKKISDSAGKKTAIQISSRWRLLQRNKIRKANLAQTEEDRIENAS
jgi:hypothetical protein